MFAKVILAKAVKTLDKPLDYEIPQGMDVELGDCVLVPFGPKNTPVQGYVSGLTQKAEVLGIKKIKEKLPIGKCFNEELLEVIRFMRGKYLCTYEDALSAVVPSGTETRASEWIVLDQYEEGSRYADILDALYENGGACELLKLKQMFSYDITNKISKLVKGGLIHREFLVDSKVKIKTVKAARLLVSKDEASKLAESFLKKHPSWSRILEILQDNECVSIKDLAVFANTGESAVKTLEKRGIIEFFQKEAYRIPKNIYKREEKEVLLTDEQKKASSVLIDAILKNEDDRFLLYGVTGSGKTEVFMQAISECLEMGKTALVLVPEISLTPQTVNRFTKRFKNRVAVLHSRLSKGERYDQWRKIREGDADIVVGARSAVFAPLSNIGVIIVDEEHSETYKSEMSPRYDAREIAHVRAKLQKSVLVLASATPRIEMFHNARLGKIKLLSLTKRVNESELPKISLVDMRAELKEGNRSMLSRALVSEITKNLEKKEQTILFLNRRGFSTFVSCRECGFTAECPDCSISLNYHKYDNMLRCHYCGYEIPNYTSCPQCKSEHIRYFGGGTQRLEEEIARLFPKASVIRMDADTTGKKQSHEEVLKRFETEKIDILVGTQMVTKGLDFENVTLVGVITADTMLHMDDYKSSERTFDILEQVTGRAGRGTKMGRAIVQTYSPEHEALLYLADHNFEGFFENEIKMRNMLWYPPFCEMVLIGFSGERIKEVSESAVEFQQGLKNIEGKLQVLGPIPSAISKIKKKHRWQIIIKCENADRISEKLLDIKEKISERYSDVLIVIDKNPVHVY